MTKKSETTQKATGATNKPEPTITITYPCKTSKDERIKDYSMALSIPTRVFRIYAETLENTIPLVCLPNIIF